MSASQLLYEVWGRAEDMYRVERIDASELEGRPVALLVSESKTTRVNAYTKRRDVCARSATSAESASEFRDRQNALHLT